VGAYNVYRRRVGDVSFGSPVSGTLVIPAGNNPVQFTENGVSISGGSDIWEYTVRAVQCTTLESTTSSPIRRFPCTFDPTILSTPPTSSNGFDGSGSSADPYIVDNGATLVVNVAQPSKVASITTNIYDGSGNLLAESGTQTTGFTWAWPTASLETYRADITVLDNVTGCVKYVTVYYEDSPQGCCLTPRSADPTVIAYQTGNNFVDIFLKNVCGDQLILQPFTMTWNDAVTPGGTKVDEIQFPQVTSGTVSFFPANNAGTSFTVTPPVNTRRVAANETTYKVRVIFSKVLVNPTQPITAFNVNYRQPTDTSDTFCPVLP
jgi:hypothetical protein